MKTFKIIPFVFLLFVIGNSCKKEEAVTPTVTSTTKVFSGCRIDVEETDISRKFKTTYGYNSDGFITDINVVNLDNPKQYNNIKAFYKDGLLSTLSDDGGDLEQYEYTNGVLSKITITSTSEASYKGYQINIEADTNKQIIAMVDSKGYRCTITRDTKGNIVELKTTKISDNSIASVTQLSDYDGKKNLSELYKGWPLNFLSNYSDYMTYRTLLFANGTSGNPRKISDLEYRYEYSIEGYPTRIETVNKTSNTITDVLKNTFEGCK